MSRSARITLAVVGSFAAVAYLALVWLTAALGGPWQLVLACIVGLCVLSLGAVVVLAWMARASADDPTEEGPEILATRPFGEPEGYDDRDRWAS